MPDVFPGVPTVVVTEAVPAVQLGVAVVGGVLDTLAEGRTLLDVGMVVTPCGLVARVAVAVLGTGFRAIPSAILLLTH